MERDTAGACGLCGGACTDLMSSLSHGGTCGKEAPATQGTRTNGALSCPDGLDLCGNDCVNLGTDKDHCRRAPKTKDQTVAGTRGDTWDLVATGVADRGAVVGPAWGCGALR